MGRSERIRIRAERVKARNDHIKMIQEMANSAPVISVDVPQGSLTIEICIHCFRYQRRLCWMLSSILQQKGDVPVIFVNISHTVDDGNPTTAEVCDFFRKQGLNIIETILKPEQIHNRSIARNIQARASHTDYILFADSDMVYDPFFFDDLQRQLKTDLKNEDKVMGADRISLNDNFCIKYFEEDNRIYPCVIPDTAGIAAKFPIKWVTGKSVAPGNFQLAKVEVLKAKGGVYCGRMRDVWRLTRSDRAFRKQMGGRIGINTRPMYHLNHDRLGPELQR